MLSPVTTPPARYTNLHHKSGYRLHAMIDDLDPNWDREPFGLFARRLEILLMRGMIGVAHRALDGFICLDRPDPPSLGSSVVTVLPVRVADKLEQAGYLTVACLQAATDGELLAISTIGWKQLDLIRTVVRAVKTGEPLGRVVHKDEPDLRPEWDIDWEYLAVCDSQTRQCMCSQVDQPSCGDHQSNLGGKVRMNEFSGKLSAALDLLDGDAEASVQQIDSRIVALEANISKLRRLRAVLSPPPPKAKGSTRIPLFVKEQADPLIDKLCAALVTSGRAMRPKELMAVTDIAYMTIGKLVPLSAGRLVKDGAYIALGEQSK
jgi:hypothetical protein